MYDLVVIANADSKKLQRRFAPLKKFVSVNFVFDRSVTRPEQFLAAVHRHKVPIYTDYYFVVRAEQRFLHLDWLRTDVMQSMMVVWATKHGVDIVPGMGLTLLPSKALPEDSLPRIDIEEPATSTPGYPTFSEDDLTRSEIPMWEKIRLLALDPKIETGYFHFVPKDSGKRKTHPPILDSSTRGDRNPIYYSSLELIDYRKPYRFGSALIPVEFGESIAPVDYLIHQGGWPCVEDTGNAFTYRAGKLPNPDYDIVMLTNGEANADRHWERLKGIYSRAIRIDGVKGILPAHVRAADLVQTEYFWVIDGDNYVHANVGLDAIRVPPLEQPQFMVWAAQNSVNDLRYGYGGIKLFHRRTVQEMRHADIHRDFAAMVAKRCAFTAMDECWSTTVIDATPREAFRAGFREALKLHLWLDENDSDHELVWVHRERLKVWSSVSHTKNGRYTLLGTMHAALMIEGEEPTGFLNGLINDYDWLDKVFMGYYGSTDSDDELNEHVQQYAGMTTKC